MKVIARILGARGFMKGLKAPFYCKQTMAMIEGMPIESEANAILEAWNRGFREAQFEATRKESARILKGE